MNRLEASARQALEALDQIATHVGQYDLPGMPNHITTLATLHRDALSEALAQQQAAEPNAVLVEDFGRVAMRKLNDLREKGYAINGVSIATISEAGETNRGAVTTGGMVLWWPAQQAAEPVAFDVVCADCGGSGLDRKDNNYHCPVCDGAGFVQKMLYTHAAPTQQAAEPVGEYVMVGRAELAMVRNALQRDADEGKQSRKEMLRALDESALPAPTQQPLTDEQIGEIGRNHEKFDKAGNEWFDRWAFARAIEAAHGITSKEGGAA